MYDYATGADGLLEGTDAARELNEAPALAGFLLPLLRGDLPVLGRGHVQLGGASAAVVRELAAWIRDRA